MLAAMTHPSRVLNLDMKAKLCMPKSIFAWNSTQYVEAEQNKYYEREKGTQLHLPTSLFRESLHSSGV